MACPEPMEITPGSSWMSSMLPSRSLRTARRIQSRSPSLKNLQISINIFCGLLNKSPIKKWFTLLKKAILVWIKRKEKVRGPFAINLMLFSATTIRKIWKKDKKFVMRNWTISGMKLKKVSRSWKIRNNMPLDRKFQPQLNPLAEHKYPTNNFQSGIHQFWGSSPNGHSVWRIFSSAHSSTWWEDSTLSKI